MTREERFSMEVANFRELSGMQQTSGPQPSLSRNDNRTGEKGKLKWEYFPRGMGEVAKGKFFLRNSPSEPYAHSLG